MFNLFRKREKRDFTVTSTDRAIAAAFGNTDTADVVGTAAATAAGGIIGRAFAAASVMPSVERTGLTPVVLAELASAFVFNGESVWVIDVDNGRVRLYRASSWDIAGTGPSGWRYQVTLPGPTGQVIRTVPAEGIVHPRVNCASAAPHRGRSPLELAGFSAKALANAERQLSEELSGPVGRLIPAPLDSLDRVDDKGNSPLDKLEASLAILKGRSALVPSMSRNWTDVQGASVGDWKSQRIGADPPESVVKLRMDGHNQLLAAAGVPPGVFEASEATGLRESLRQFLHVTIGPLARVLETEASDKLGVKVALDFTALHASDVQGRARAFKSMVDGGMTLADAAAASGILQPES